MNKDCESNNTNYISEDNNDSTFEIAGLKIENDMPDNLKDTIKRYNQLHQEITKDIMDEKLKKIEEKGL